MSVMQSAAGAVDATPPTAGDPNGLANGKQFVPVHSSTVRFAGDSGDGMQVVGSQFADIASMTGLAVCTQPDYPSEIRAPAGSLGGVSGFQLSFADFEVHTPGDSPYVLVAMNPAALNAKVLNDEGRDQLMIMGCYGIGVSRVVAAAIEQNHDAQGIIWPDAIAPFQIAIVPLNAQKSEAVRLAAEQTLMTYSLASSSTMCGSTRW